MKMFLIFIYFTLRFLISALGVNNLKIINGTNVGQNDFMFMVSLQYENSHMCGGTVLTPEYVLTAAHCVCNRSTSNLTVLVTHFSLENPNRPSSISIRSVVCHNYSTMENINDIAILKLNEQIPRSMYHPVQLVSMNFSLEEDTNGTLLGWGLTADGKRPDILLKVDVIVYDDVSCQKSHFSMYNMDQRLCAGWPENGRGSCQGDSGGPLLIEGQQVGIISFGIGDCGNSNRQQPKVLTRVSSYLHWINKIIKTPQGEGNNNTNNHSSKCHGHVFPLVILFLSGWLL